MSVEKVKEGLKLELQAAKERVKELESLVAMMEKRTVAEAIVRVAARLTADGGAAPPPSHFDRIVKFFRGRKNEWATAAEVAAGTGIKTPEIARDVMGSTKKQSFEAKPTGPNEPKKFRLAPNAMK